MSPEEVQLCYQIALNGRNDMGLAPDEYAGFTMALLRMLAFRPAGTRMNAPVRAPAVAAAPDAGANGGPGSRACAGCSGGSGPRSDGRRRRRRSGTGLPPMPRPRTAPPACRRPRKAPRRGRRGAPPGESPPPVEVLPDDLVEDDVGQADLDSPSRSTGER